MENNIEKVAELLQQTGQSHHAAFIEVDGADPEWPLWYANHLHDRLSRLLKEEITKSELVFLFMALDRRYQLEKPALPWYSVYARALVERTDPIGCGTISRIDDIPSLTTNQMIEVDRAMIEDYQIDLVQMMENAGRNLAHLARRRFLDYDPRGRRVTVLTGTGGNGGGAMVAARHLANYGAQVTVITTRTAESFKGIPGRQLAILEQMKVAMHQDEWLAKETAPLDLIIDGIIGYSLRGAPRGSAASLIRWANEQNAPILALDIPSGIDGTTGIAYDPAIIAAATMTLALPKAGLIEGYPASSIGELYLADISVPPALYTGPGLELDIGPLFAIDDIVRLI